MTAAIKVLLASFFVLYVSALRLGGAPKVAVQVGSAALASFVLVAPPVTDVLEGRAPSMLVRSAHADVRAAQKRTFFRQTPRLVEGGAFWAKDVKTAIDKEDWKVIEKLFEEYASKMNGSQKDQVDIYDTYVNDKFLRPMQLLAGSFAERGTSEKQRVLMAHRDEFLAATEQLKGSVIDVKESGFFGKTIKAPTGNARKQQATAAFAAAKKAYNEYITDLNLGLMLELNKLSTI